MIRLEYNAQLNTKSTIFKFYTPWEFFVGLVLTFATVAVPIVFGYPPSFVDAMTVFAGFTLFLIYFKIGKPEGYLGHLLKHLAMPSNFRPGHKAVQYPVRPPLETLLSAQARPPERLWADCQQAQLRLLDAGLVPNGSYGGYIHLSDPADIERARDFISRGGVLAVGPEFEPPPSST